MPDERTTLTAPPVISIVVPCYNEEAILPLFYKEISRILDTLKAALAENIPPCSGECIFVDDGSADATALLIQDIGRRDSRVHYIIFSRNFGKEAAQG